MGDFIYSLGLSRMMNDSLLCVQYMAIDAVPSNSHGSSPTGTPITTIMCSIVLFQDLAVVWFMGFVLR